MERCLACEAAGRNLWSCLTYETYGKQGLPRHPSRRAAIFECFRYRDHRFDLGLEQTHKIRSRHRAQLGFRARLAFYPCSPRPRKRGSAPRVPILLRSLCSLREAQCGLDLERRAWYTSSRINMGRNLTIVIARFTSAPGTTLALSFAAASKASRTTSSTGRSRNGAVWPARSPARVACERYSVVTGPGHSTVTETLDDRSSAQTASLKLVT